MKKFAETNYYYIIVSKDREKVWTTTNELVERDSMPKTSHIRYFNGYGVARNSLEHHLYFNRHRTCVDTIDIDVALKSFVDIIKVKSSIQEVE